ncbi:leukemia inhibitory factor receptor [Polymixia lowei]
MNLQRDSPYQVRVRQKSTQALNSLWSDWSQVQTVPAEIENGPEVILATTEAFENGTRLLKLSWKAVPRGAAVSGVTYVLEDSQSNEGCPCLMKKKKKKIRDQTEYSIYVTNFYININITAINTVGTSPPTLFHEPAKPAKDLKACDRHGSVPKVKQPRTCLQWYEYRSGSTRPDTVNTVKGKDRYQQMATKMKDFVRYYYFEHKCVSGTPQTIETCLFYKKEGAPRKPPVLNIGTTQTSADLSWKEIPIEDQQGFLTHYTVCSVRTSSSRQAHTKECYNVSASHTRYRLENLTPGSRYNISLAGATKAGVGPIAVVYINTASKKPVTGGRFSEALQFSSSLFVWLSLSLVMVFFLTSIMCTSVCKRMKNRIFPPIPKPVIPDSAYRPDNQEILEMKEEVQELSLHQLQDNRIQESEDLEETTFLGEVCETDGDREEALEDGTIVGGSRTPEGSDEPLSPSYKSQFLRCSGDLEITDLGQEDNEITTLMYRNGLVFDMKADSTEDVGIPQLGRGN